MDPSAFQRRGAGTTSINTIDILRSLFALDPITNLPISSFYTITTDGIGGVNWMSQVNYISSSLGIDNLPSTLQRNSTSISYIIPGLSTLSTAIGNGGIPGSVTGGQLVSTATGLTNGLGSLGYISTLGLNSTITGLGSLGFLSSISSLQPTLNSTLKGLGSLGFLSTVQPSLNSTIQGLGSLGFLSTVQPSLNSTIQGLGSLGFLSTVQPSLNSTIQGLGSLGFLSTVQPSLNSTIEGLNAYGYVNTVNLVSTTVNLQSNLNQLMSPAAISSFVIYGTNTFTAGVSIGILNIYPQDVSTLSSGIGYNLTGFLISSFLFSTVIGLGTAGYLSTAVIQPTVNSTIQGLGSLGFLSTGATQPSLNSTIEGLGSIGFLSTGATQPSLNSTIEGLGSLGFLSSISSLQPSLNSTLLGLGTLGFLSTVQPSLNSTIEGLGSLGFLSTSLNQININSTVQGLGSLGFISTSVDQNNLNSTVKGLGTFGFLSSISSIQPTLNSTLKGLGTFGFISTSVGQVNLNSTLEGLGTFGFISTAVTQPTLNSTLEGLGTFGFLSSVSSIQPTLNSTLTGLTSLGYVSTSMLYSTSIGLANSFYIVNTGQIYITGGTAIIGNASNVIYLSSFLHSSITYSGNNGAFTASNAGAGSQPLYFSSANFKLDSFSSYITNKSLISIEAYPNILFSKIALPASVPVLIYISTMLQDGVNFMSTNLSQTVFYPTDTTNSNFFNQPIRITFPGNTLTYRNPYVLTHYLPNAVTSNVTQGLYTSNVTLAFGSTNSLFVSIQNLPS
jgi:hypothetical protein